MKSIKKGRNGTEWNGKDRRKGRERKADCQERKEGTNNEGYQRKKEMKEGGGVKEGRKEGFVKEY